MGGTLYVHARTNYVRVYRLVLVPNNVSFQSVFDDSFGGRDDMDMNMAESNNSDLAFEYQQYAKSAPRNR